MGSRAAFHNGAALFLIGPNQGIIDGKRSSREAEKANQTAEKADEIAADAAPDEVSPDLVNQCVLLLVFQPGG